MYNDLYKNIMNRKEKILFESANIRFKPGGLSLKFQSLVQILQYSAKIHLTREFI